MSKLFLVSLVVLTVTFQSCGQSTFKNITYSYRAKIPTDWNLISEIKTDSVKNFSSVEWTLPKLISESSGNEIENSIEIYAYKNAGITNIEELLAYEKQKWHTFLLDVDITLLDSDNTWQIVNTSKVESFDHKSKIYLIFKNGICYRVQYVSTPDTFDRNLAVFEKFYDAFEIK